MQHLLTVAAVSVSLSSVLWPQTTRTKVEPFDCNATTQLPSQARVTWKGANGDVRWGEWLISAGPANMPLRIVVVDIDVATTRFALELKRDGNRIAPWTIDDVPADAVVAFNAGQFSDDGPWGWVVHRSREWQAPGVGSIAGALVTDSADRVSILDAGEIDAARRSGRVKEAVQSYPTLLDARGSAPLPLCADDRGVDRGHRDTRLAVGTTVNGHMIVALSRFDALGEPAGRIPLGPTTPEMATIMRALGATRALMLDGGLSAQMLMRDGAAIPQRWPGIRSVPLTVVVTSTTSEPPAKPSLP